MIFLILLSLLILVLIGFLFLPMELTINTFNNQYQITFKGLAKMWLEADKDSILKIGLKVFFFTRYFSPFDKRKKQVQKTRKGVKKKENKKKGWSLGQIIALLRTFRLKRFRLDIDTGDYITNAKLYPVFALINFYGLPCQINFRDTNGLILQIQNRPIHLLKSFINYKTKSHGFTI
ncbi:hypothetical protein ACOKFD_14150 [Flagellimonas sp. S174]|uniref:hypothetical protein n=1 Tax=Flagellimonas sp. S174 TaxID=3410790 RepID=UPI003BF5B31B